LSVGVEYIGNLIFGDRYAYCNRANTFSNSFRESG